MQMRRLLSLIFGIFAFILMNGALASAAEFGSKKPHFSATYWTDPSNQNTPDRVLQQTEQVSLMGDAVIITERNLAHWVSLHLDSSRAEAEYVIVVPATFGLKVAFFNQFGQQLVSSSIGTVTPVNASELAAELKPHDDKDISAEHVLFVSAKGNPSLYLRFEAPFKDKIKLQVLTPESYFAINSRNQAWLGLEIGLISFIAVFIAVVAIVTKNPISGYVAGYFASITLLMLSMSNIAATLFSPSVSRALVALQDVWIILAIVLSLSFYRMTYRLKDHDPKFNQGLHIAIVTLVVLAGMVVISPLTLPFQVIACLIVAGAMVNLWMISYYRRKSIATNVVLAAWVMLLVLFTYWLLVQFGVRLPWSMHFTVHVAMVAHVGCLSLAMFLREQQRKQAFTFYAQHDSETGAPNRTFLFKNLKALVEHNREHTLLLFKPLVIEQTRINFGMDYAQKHLKILLNKLNDQLSVLAKSVIETTEQGNVYVYRLEDSVFAIVLEGKMELSQIEQYVCLLSSVFEEGVKFKGAQLVDQMEVGVANFPLHASNPDQLVQRALQALSVKTISADRWHIFDIANSVMSERRVKISAALKDAIEQNQFELYLQPQVNLQTGQVYGAEALLRWQHPVLGHIPPDQFIPIAESSGMIHELTEWVIEKGLTYQKELVDIHAEHMLSLNISGKDLARRELPVHLITLLTQLELAPSKITLEITESATIGNASAIRGVFEDYRQIGVKMAIDDFGTGYSSLAYLTHLGFDELKIDKQFVMNMENMPTNQTICKATCDMAHSLGAKVVAEGIESHKCYMMLKRQGCNYGQGYYIARPMSFSEYRDWLGSSQITLDATSSLSN
ncbi:putative bifunctional diguanylate cyclase/phosphodiesterase [Pseudoalteromonas fenneropenaei]|uniref:Bifunctional diguanylate cyclase/phosphodiesterase n=1 Tax=Pseudoalteromonas fenneropenaei TaxID=1737459 RepID=A0ABV7CF51_9GAMM